ncbi:hypothetical protein BC936DRAFT_145687 [Jimgerdemannia flammicorona]|uniref:Secreted protein n=1 Tax=Jimgerdemannia flammicorona TaxID=994334 RepID=A0A433D9I3_9FUNG|nr:hypothetical protein BC936DRAFT_145687 [Jimgerdemannia flammicorona]
MFWWRHSRVLTWALYVLQHVDTPNKGPCMHAIWRQHRTVNRRKCTTELQGANEQAAQTPLAL